MFAGTKYEKEFFKKTLSGREYTIVNLTPAFKPEEKNQAENEVKSRLFQVFKKYIWNLVFCEK